MGTPAPATCLPRTHRRCLRGGCFAGRKITTRRHLRSPLTACRASWKMFCQKGRLPRGKHFRPPLPACRASWKMFCRKGKVPHRRVSGKVTSRQGLRFRFGKCHEESTSAHHATQQMFCLKAIKGKRDPRRPLHYPPTTKHQPQTKQRLEL